MAFIDRYFIMMVEKGVSDLHLNSGNVPMWRLHGDIEAIHEEGVIPKDMAQNIIYEIMPEENKNELKDKFMQNMIKITDENTPPMAGFGRGFGR